MSDDLIRRLRLLAGRMALGSGGVMDSFLLDKAADALKSAQEDKERYRWLRDSEIISVELFDENSESLDPWTQFTGEELDAVIDARREKEKQK